MADKEKVIRALDCLSRNAQDGACAGCAYFRPFTDDPDTGWCDSKTAMADALAMLREQEPVEPIRLENWWKCPSCGGNIVANMKYCPRCGRKVKWEWQKVK